MSSEAKVGVFVVIAALLTFVIAAFLSDFLDALNSYTVTAHFRDAQGLARGSEVHFAGVKVGKVRQVYLESHTSFKDRPAAVLMKIARGAAPIYDTDEFYIQQGALLGDKYVEIRRDRKVLPKGKLSDTKDPHVGGLESPTLTSLANDARGLVADARTLIASASAALDTVKKTAIMDAYRDAIRTVLTNIVSATQLANQLGREGLALAASLRKSAAQTGPEVAEMAGHLHRTAEAVQNTALLIQTTVSTSPLPADMAQAGANVRQATGDLAAVSDNLASVLADPATRNRLEGMLANLQQSSENLSKLTSRAEALASDKQMEEDVRAAIAKLRESADNLADLTAHAKSVMTDPVLTADLQATVKGARGATESAKATADKADASLDRVNQTMDRVSGVVSGLRPEAVRPRATLTGTDDDGLRGDFDLDIQWGRRRNDFWRLGVRDIGDAETLNLQKALPAGRDTRWRVGIFGSKVGVGLDLRQSHKLGFEAELWDPEEFNYGVTGQYGIARRMDFLFGVTDTGDGAEPFAGVRYQTER